jgi:hypothetical protein
MLLAEWQEAQSACADGEEWSNCSPAGTVEFMLVRSPTGREFAWQSMQEVGCGSPAAVRAGWNCAGEVPARFIAQLACTVADGLRWQVPQFVGTMLVVVGASFAQTTASCFISPDAGVRAGLVAVGPTNPTGIEFRWHEAQAIGSTIVGSVRARLASEEWRFPG